MLHRRLGLMMATALLPCLAVPAWAQAAPPPMAQILPQDDILPASLDMLYLNREDIDQALVVVEMGLGMENPQWLMSATQREVLLDTLLQFMPDRPLAEDAIWPQLKRLDPKYRGIRVALRTVFGKRFETFTVHEGKVISGSGDLVVNDYGRRLEYWLFGTSRIRRDQMMGAHVLPVITFEQCRLLGQQIVDTKPRQCLLPDNNLLLETNELPTLKSARIRDFDGCLQDGKALIYTFPRRCLAAGGRVFTEPPRVYEVPGMTPPDAPLLAPNALSVPPAPAPLPGNASLQLNTTLTGPVPSGLGAVSGTPVLP